MYIRINDASFDDLPVEQQEWLEKQFDGGFGAGAGKFCAITDGDWSLIREIDTEAVTLDYILENHPGEYIALDKDSPEAATLRSREDCTERKGWWTDQALFVCE